ncbi:SNF2 domain protein [Parasponia andersonii]|uniref:SNF2 domain protein n=1 Tax=Parasponia andersonii TaxID=3476 RepID=A0A2P5DTX1_PARAD|nr:SNF2 domain protein [Parasponia andersonii]
MNQTLSKSYQNPNPNLPDPFVSMLKESIHRFIADYRNSVTDFSNFSSIFSRVLHGIPDPPVEIVWFYSAVTFHSTKLTAQDDPSGRVSAIKDLFQLLVSCSASCSAAKRIAILAPVVYELCNLAFDTKERFEEEIQSLLEGLISYFSICCGGNGDHRDGDDDGGLNSCFLDVIRVWVVDRIGVGDELEAFFPIVSDDVRKGLRMMRGGVGDLAGLVMCEAFLLKLCLKLGLQTSRAELEKEVRNWAVQTLTGFQCFFFFDTLFRMLLEPVLPVTNLLNSKDMCLLQVILYDSVIMVDYSFLKPQIGIQSADERYKNLAVTWLLVADNAIRFVRKDDDQTKVISYVNAFVESCLASHLIKWLTNHIGMEGKIFRPNVSTPVALIKWMLLVEEQGVRVFDCDISKLRAKGVICESRVEFMLPVTKPDGKTQDTGDLEMVDSVNTVSVAADGTINTQATDGARKRKGTVDGMGVQVKFVRYYFDEEYVKKGFPSLGSDDSLSSESEVDNPVYDRAMEDMQP